MRVSFITTLAHNVGDDFVREGILYLLDALGCLGDAQFIHKHSPVTAVFGLEGVRVLPASRAIEPVSRLLGLRNRISAADVLVQSGAPVYWCHPGGPHCADNEWFDPLVRKRFLRDRRGRKFLNLAGGSCQTYFSDGSEIERCAKCAAYLREFFDACTLTLLRDEVARAMLRKAGRDAEVLPCTSIFARDRLGIGPEKGEFIALNVMENAGHYTFGQTVDSGRWRTTFQQLTHAAKKRGRVVVACHNKAEDALARKLVPDTERFLVPDDHVQFMKFYSRARFGVVNRVHAGFMMASFGKPVAVIGNDSRARMVSNLNAEHHFVGDLGPTDAENLVAALAAREFSYAEEIESVRSRAKDKYLTAIANALL